MGAIPGRNAEILKRVIVIVTVWIAIIWAVAFWATRLALGPSAPGHVPANPLERWDAAFYRGLATQTPIDRQDAFFPLFPLAVRGTMELTRVSFGTAASILNAFLTIADVLLLWLLIKRSGQHNTAAATWTIVAFLSLPTSFVLLAPYPVALLFFLALISWYGVLSRSAVLAIGAGCGATFVHPTGAVFVLAAIVSLWRSIDVRNRVVSVNMVATTAAIFVATGVWSRFHAARIGFSLFPGVHFWTQGIWYFTTFDSATTAAMVLVGTAIVAGVAVFALGQWWKHDRWQMMTAAGLLFLAVTSGLWIGTARYLIPAVIIPMAIARIRPWLRIPVLILSGVVELLWVGAFVSWRMFV